MNKKNTLQMLKEFLEEAERIRESVGKKQAYGYLKRAIKIILEKAGGKHTW